MHDEEHMRKVLINHIRKVQQKSFNLGKGSRKSTGEKKKAE
jgi:hypothetical protein